MSLWASYHKERKGWETIEVESGFISYSLNPPEAVIEEFYVKPEMRGSPLAKRLADQVVSRVKEAGVKRLWAKVVVGLPGSDYSMRLNLKYGFKLVCNQGNDTVMMMEV